MIPRLCIQALISFLDLSFGAIESSPLPGSVTHFLAMGVNYMKQGFTLLAAYVDLPYIISLVAVVAAIDAALFMYKVALWIWKKIPFWGVK